MVQLLNKPLGLAYICLNIYIIILSHIHWLKYEICILTRSSLNIQTRTDRLQKCTRTGRQQTSGVSASSATSPMNSSVSARSRSRQHLRSPSTAEVVVPRFRRKTILHAPVTAVLVPEFTTLNSR